MIKSLGALFLPYPGRTLPLITLLNQRWGGRIKTVQVWKEHEGVEKISKSSHYPGTTNTCPLPQYHILPLLFRKPSFNDHLRAFACECFASTTAVTRTKFDPRSRRCVFIGYPFNVKGYEVFDLNSHLVSILRDVIFQESFFPRKTFDSCPSNVPSVPLPCTSFLPFDDVPSPSPSHTSTPPSISSNLDDTIHQVHHELDDDFLHDVLAEPPEPLVDPIPLRQSSKAHKKPSYFKITIVTRLLHHPLPLFFN